LGASVIGDKAKKPLGGNFNLKFFIKGYFRFRCQACGSRAVDLMPDRSGYRAEGMGRRMEGKIQIV
jgi:hypothetical protein